MQEILMGFDGVMVNLTVGVLILVVLKLRVAMATT